jgi:hypothetical protein
MKTVRIFSILAIIGITLFSACQRMEDLGAFQEEIKTYDLTGFQSLQIGSASKVTVQQGSTFSVVVRGDRRNLDELRVRVEGGTLKADYYPHHSRRRQYPSEFTITMPSLSGVDFSGSTTANISGFESNSALYIRLSGSSEGTFSVRPRETDINLSGSSKLRISGASVKSKSEISGGSVLESFNFSTEESQVAVSGGSNARVNVSKVLNAAASGGSHIRYIGNPTIVTNNASGGSSISKD